MFGIIERSDIVGLQAAVRDIVTTKLTLLSRQIEEQKREFLRDERPPQGA